MSGKVESGDEEKNFSSSAMTMENKGVKDETKFSEEHKLKSNYKEN
jgi:hypothetical protein